MIKLFKVISLKITIYSIFQHYYLKIVILLLLLYYNNWLLILFLKNEFQFNYFFFRIGMFYIFFLFYIISRLLHLEEIK